MILGALLVAGYRYWRLRFGAPKWTLVEGRIQSGYAANMNNAGLSVLGGATHVAAAHKTGWRAALQYSYQVAGEFYSGYFLLGPSYYSPETAKAATQDWVDRTILVRYNPSKPHQSAFLPVDGAPKGSRSYSDQPPPSSDLISLSLK